jgi:hypothetical protein
VRRGLLVLVTALLLILILTTGQANSQGAVHIEGIVDCGEWVKARTDAQAGYLEHYLIGLINGLTLGRNLEFWHANGSRLSREAVYLGDVPVDVENVK